MSSAKGSFDRFDNELTQNAANIVMLDRTLLEYGPETDGDINSTRALIHAQRYDSIPTSLLLVLCAWLSLIFLTFGLFAPRNAVVVGMLLMCSVAASATVFLILEMHLPFDRVITLSSAPMRDALQYLGR